MSITDANKFIADIHDRVPVPLDEVDFKPWLTGKAFKTVSEDLLHWRTGKSPPRCGR